MKRIIFYFLIFLAAVWLGVIMHNNPGFVLIAFKNWSIETSIWFAFLTLLITFMLLFLVLRFQAGVREFFRSTKHWFANHKQTHAKRKTILGLYELAEGDWRKAEKHLIKFAKNSDMPLINYLAAALLAQRQRAFERRDSYLRQAQKNIADHPTAIALTQAILQVENEQWEEACATLRQLHQQKPKNAFILFNLYKTCEQLHEWEELQKLLPKLYKEHIISNAELIQLEEKIYFELLCNNLKSGNSKTFWLEMPKHLQKNPLLLAVYAEYLIANSADAQAEALLKLALRKKPDKKLLELYSKLKSNNPLKLLARTESWLRTNPQNADLLFCLGTLCKQQMLWGKARHYFTESIKFAPSAQAYFELASIMEQQNDLPAAIEYYKAASML